MHSRLDVYITGTFDDGIDRERAVSSYAALTGSTPAQARALFEGAPSRVKADCDPGQANDFQKQLGTLGIRSVLRPAGSELIPPSEQTDATAGSARPASTRATAGEAAAGPVTRVRKTFMFSGKGLEYFRIWIVNLVLTIVTLGLYSPWAKIRSRRYFYGNTSLDGATFDYNPDPWRMLAGRLIALVFFALYNWFVIINPPLGALAGFALMLVSPWAINKSLAFNARYTTYRNIRFRFDGTYNEALVTFLLWPIAAAMTLGILAPMMVQRMQKFIINHHRYGNKGFNFNAGAGQFYRLFLTLIGIVILGGILMAVVSGIVGAQAALTLPIFLGIYAFALVYYATRLNNIVYNHSSLASNNFEASFEIRGYGWVMLSNLLLIILTLGLYLPFAMIRVAHYKARHIALDVAGDLDDFVAITAQEQSALGEEFSDVFDLDVGF